MKKPEQRKQSCRKTSFAQQLRGVPVESVAAIAANLLQREAITPAEATSRAFELLELAAGGQRSLEDRSEWQSGIDAAEASKAQWIEWQELDKVPDLTSESEEHRSTIPLKEVLNALMPDKRKVKETEREPRLRHWIMSARQCDFLQAADVLAEWKRGGVPRQAFQHLRLTFWKWWEDSKSETASRSGKAGAEAKKKAKQGRVKSKKDKRLGARLPDA